VGFNTGFPIDYIDGPPFANKFHFCHPTIDGHPETVDPSQQSTFSSSELYSLWKEIQKEYEKLYKIRESQQQFHKGSHEGIPKRN
jgi:hypothetical protein